MQAPVILKQCAKVTVADDTALMDPAAPRGTIVTVTLTDGTTVSQFTKFPPNTAQNPLVTAVVSAKARDLMTPELGASKTEMLIDRLNNLETVGDMRHLRPLFTT